MSYNKIDFHTIEQERKKICLPPMTPGESFIHLVLRVLFPDLTKDDIADSICDGSNDGSIDAIIIEETVIHLFNFKHTEKFDNSKNAFPANELVIFASTVKKILGNDLIEDEFNKQLSEKITEINDLIIEKPDIDFQCYFCTNKQEPSTTSQKRICKELEEITRKKSSSIHFYDQTKIAKLMIRNRQKKVDGVIRFIDKQYFSRDEKPSGYTGIFALVSAEDIVKLVSNEEDGTINSNVFDSNVRTDLRGEKNSINQRIYDTLMSSDNQNFWIMNNGINIVCDKCKYQLAQRSPPVKLENFQIVNGGQTTRVIFEAFRKNPEKLQDVLVLVRICETENNELHKIISEATNSQTVIKNRDLRSNDNIQKKLETQFESLGYKYERKRNQFKGCREDITIDAEHVAQAYMAFELGLPSNAKNNKQSIWDKKYDNIFNENITAEKMLHIFKLYQAIYIIRRKTIEEKKKKTKIDDKKAFISYAAYHILYACRLILDRYNKQGNKKLDVVRNKNHQQEIIEEAINSIYEIIRREKENDENYTHLSFFKKIATNEKIKKYIEKR